MSFEKACPIWHREDYTENDFAEFCDTVTYSGGSAKFCVSVAGDYTLFINGKYVESNQYGDFSHYKVYDEIDITPHLKKGENTISVLAWYFGKSGMRYCTPCPMLIFEVKIDGETVLYSSEKTPSRRSKAYERGFDRKISAQFGYSFSYDATKEDGWLSGERADFGMSAKINEEYIFTKRPTKKLVLDKTVKGEIIKTDSSYIIDLGREIVGLPTFSIVGEKPTKINVAYGELLENGHVKRIIDGRYFSFDYVAKSGKNEFTSYMLRFAARYIEITSDAPINIDFAGIIPQSYPVGEKKFSLENQLDQRIYDICVNTLKLCMMEHYVDCPWREQCLYAFDSRNQMLSGYAVFENCNFDYARANLLLMSKDRREDGLLSICFPSGEDLTIPSFSLYFILAVQEYMEKSGDNTLGEEVFDKIESILSVFKNQMENGLATRFEGFGYWNFYDWSHLGYIRRGKGIKEPDFLLNVIFVIGLNAYNKICEKLGRENKYSGLSERIKERLNEDYFDRESGTYFIQEKTELPTELANALAVVSGVAEGDVADGICEKLSKDQLETCSLSMKVFKYDALIKVNKDKYKDVILDEIRNTYKVMLDAGTGTVWETIEGGAAFENAGSLCHGWSSVPVHYYHLFLE